MRTKNADTIPKLDQVDYLFIALSEVAEESTFSEIRKYLVEAQPADRFKHQARRTDLLWSTARESIRELMKLGLIEPSALPSRAKHYDAHRDAKYRLTNAGRDFVALESDGWSFRDRFAQALLLAHPILQEIVQQLMSREIYIPRLLRSDIPGDVEQWRDGPPSDLFKIVRYLASEVKRYSDIELDNESLQHLLQSSLSVGWSRIDWNNKDNVVTKRVIKLVNDASLRALLRNGTFT